MRLGRLQGPGTDFRVQGVEGDIPVTCNLATISHISHIFPLRLDFGIYFYPYVKQVQAWVTIFCLYNICGKLRNRQESDGSC